MFHFDFYSIFSQAITIKGLCCCLCSTTNVVVDPLSIRSMSVNNSESISGVLHATNITMDRAPTSALSIYTIVKGES